MNRGLVRSRSLAAEMIKKGVIRAQGEIIRKPAKDFPPDIRIEILEQPKYVSRGGLKLEAALENFAFNPENLICLDVGASTGGFTDCLLQHGAKKVYAVDVGHGQLSPIIKSDPRVISLEGTDIRKMEAWAEAPDLAVIDVSFISLEMVLPRVHTLLKDGGKVIALIKPQFETDRQDKNGQGIVKTERLQRQALKKIQDFVRKNGWRELAVTDSPILGGSGNKEYLLYLQKEG
jgi:23S rRNA (cytidine1920-2'-O)/16S rRNA (cytidine1409-2'-O)-methyltransferase